MEKEDNGVTKWGTALVFVYKIKIVRRVKLKFKLLFNIWPFTELSF